MHHFGELFLIILNLFWFVMLIHALFNRGLSGGQKFFWLFLIFFTNFIGAVIYFLTARKAGSRRVQRMYQSYQPYQQKRYQPPFQPNRQPPQQPYYRPTQPAYQPPAQTQEPVYQPYQQGYAIPSNSQPERPAEIISQYNQYEYPQAIYPEQEQAPKQSQ